MPPTSYAPAFDDQQKELDMQSKIQHINLAITYLRKREDTTGTQNTDTSQGSRAASPPTRPNFCIWLTISPSIYPFYTTDLQSPQFPTITTQPSHATA
jgi:hypothetical protein